jgi:hypothetical protein
VLRPSPLYLAHLSPLPPWIDTPLKRTFDIKSSKRDCRWGTGTMGDQFGGGSYLGSGASYAPTYSGKPSASDEAFLLSHATNTAMIAARSILMSGGTEETALKTAKAAAQSVLNPGCSDNDTVSGKSTKFLRRRKAKRQAEVVASMALISAASKVRQGSHDWEMMSTSEQSQHHHALNMMYPSNVVAFNYGARDDPSVLSGSVRSPRKGQSVLPPRAQRLQSTPEKKEKKPPRAPARPNDEKAPRSNSKLTQPLKKEQSKQASIKNSSSRGSRSSPSPEHTEPSQSRRHSGKGTGRKNQVESAQQEDPVYSNVSTEVSNPVDLAINSIYIPSSSSGDDEETVDTLTTAGENTSDKRRDGQSTQGKAFIQQHLDPVLTSFTNAFNAFTCGPLTAFVDESEGTKTPKSRKDHRSSKGDKTGANADARDDHEDQNSFSGEETDANDDDDTKGTNLTDDRDNDSKMTYDSDLKNPLSASRSGSNTDGSYDSEQIIKEVNMSSSTEGEIKVRSSIRDTMEKIVSKSNKTGYGDESPVDRTWMSYELRQGEIDSAINEPPRQEPKKKKKKKKTRMKPEESPTSPTSTQGDEKAKKGKFRFPKTSRKHKADKAYAQPQGSF